MKQIIIDGIPTDYCITKDGRCWSNKSNKWLKGSLDKDGYQQYSLCMPNGQYKTRRANRLVALHYIPNDNPEEKNQVNHIDGNKLNNNVKNLEWVSCKENIRHAMNTGLRNSNVVYQYDKYGNLLATYDAITDAAEALNLNPTHIGDCCNGTLKSSGGFYWSYQLEEKKPHRVQQRHLQKVFQYTKDGQLLNSYDTLKEAALDNNIKAPGHIGECCRGKRKSCGGYIWSYEEVAI